MDEKRDGSQLPAAAKGAEVEAFLRQVAAMPAARPASGRGRLIFAMDATASREPSWDRACRIQGEMFEATAALGGLEVQLVFYRGFDECKASQWLSTAAAAPPRHARGLLRRRRDADRARAAAMRINAARARAGQRAGLRRRRDGGNARRAAAASPASSACWACRSSSSTRAAIRPRRAPSRRSRA